MWLSAALRPLCVNNIYNLPVRSPSDILIMTVKHVVIALGAVLANNYDNNQINSGREDHEDGMAACAGWYGSIWIAHQ